MITRNKSLSILLSFIVSFLAIANLAQGQSNEISLVGTWSGDLVIGQDAIDMGFTFTADGDNYKATFISRRMGIYGMPAETMEVNNNRITIRLELLAADYTGRIRMNDDGTAIEFIDGEWFQEAEMVPVMLRKVED